MHIRYIGAALSGLLIIFGFALPALANTTNKSTSPTYAAQPFSFYCNPYIRSFEEDKHYKPTDGPCLFTVPSAIAGTKVISIFKGVPGASTFVAGDQVFASPTLVQEDNVVFGTPLQDQDYFSVIYGGSSLTELSQFQAAFATGSTTGTLLPSDNYRLIKWKWGGKPVSEYEPVIIIPDMLNSWVTDTGPVLDPIFKTYQNSIDTFVSNGYVLNQTIYPFPYNWEDSLISTTELLAIKIANIKAVCGCSRVDIVAHGTGGYAAIKYIESAGYTDDVDQLILLGTPFFGIPAAYRALEGGQISFGNPLSDGLAQAFLNQEAKDAGYANLFSYIQQKPNTAFKEVIPAFSDYLFDSGFNALSYPVGYPQNTFLESLLTGISAIFTKIVTQTVLSDDGLGLTPSQFVVGASSQPPLWPHGQPTLTLTESGDGLVTRASIENLVGIASLDVAGSHRAIPNNAQNFVFNSLNNKLPSPLINNVYPVSCVLFITTSAGTDMQITDPNGLRLGKNFSDSSILSEVPNALYSGFAASTEYGMVANPTNGTYTIQTQGSSSGSFTINTSDVCSSGTISTSTTAFTTAGQIIGYGLSVSTSTQTLSLTPLDSTPPVITITNPIAGNTYYDNETVFLNATINDASAIAATSYTFNGNPVDQGQQLPLLTAPLGANTVSVAATDVFGNAASTSVTFFVRSSDTQPPIIVITNPVAGQSYLNTATVIPAATIADISGIAASAFYLNGIEVNRTLPLPLSTTAAGPATLRVSATDTFGNSTSTSVIFTVVAPPSLDTQGPVITIISPERGRLYVRSEKIYAVATFTDQSPVVSKNYYLNGKRIDPAKPLTFMTAPLGTSTLNIRAKDTFGNVGYATSTFHVVPAPASCIEDITEAYDRKWVQDKKTFTMLFGKCKQLEDLWRKHDKGEDNDADIDRVNHELGQGIKRNEEDDKKNEWGKWSDNDDD